MATLNIDHVSKNFGSTQVLDDINIDLKDGEFLILVGPSGCGKSTLLNMIAGLESITAGTITMDDRRVNGLSPRERDIAMVFQFYALYPNMNVRRNIEFGLKMRGADKQARAKAVQSVARTLQIENLLNRKPSQLSGGQRQRVAIGRALARHPSLFLFDEPLSNLDAKLRVEMRAEIKQLHQRVQTTMVYVTHDQVEAMTLGDRIAVMGNGKVQQLGTPYDVYSNPVNRYVAGFIGSPSMNFIECEYRSDADAGANLQLSNVAVDLPLPPATLEQLRAHANQKVVLGVRPEHLVPAEAGTPGSLPCRVDLVEPTGPDTYLHARVNEIPVVARCAPTFNPEVDSEVSLALDGEQVYFFEPSEGTRIA